MAAARRSGHGKRVELATVGVVQFEGDKLASEQLYWDQASVLVQVGLLDRDRCRLSGRKPRARCSTPICRPTSSSRDDRAESHTTQATPCVVCDWTRSPRRRG